MFAYRATPAAGAPYVLVATSGGPDQNEVVNSTSVGGLTAGAKWRVYVHGCSVAGSSRPIACASLPISASNISPRPAKAASYHTTASDTVAPSSSPRAQGGTRTKLSTATASAAGLPAGNRYLGRVIYVDPGPPATGMAATTVAVSTR